MAARHEPPAAAHRGGRPTMKAWQVHQLGELRDVLTLSEEVPDPEPGSGQIFVRVLAAAANFPDILMCQGGYQVKPPLPFTPGLERGGEVVALGPGVTGLAPGDRVVGPAALPAGAFGEVAIMDAASAYPAPESFDDAEAAAFYISYQTGWFGLHRRGPLEGRGARRGGAGPGGGGAGAGGRGRSRQRCRPARQGGRGPGHRRGRWRGEGGRGPRPRGRRGDRPV